MIDLRSDTVTQPSDAMRAAMAAADVGDDVYGDDPSVNRLESRTAELLGKQAGLFVASGSMGNLVSILAQCGRGDAVVCGLESHVFADEGGSAAVLGGVQYLPVPRAGGAVDLAAAEAAVPPLGTVHNVPRATLLAIENTFHGMPTAAEHAHQARAVADRFELSLHLDGARLWNAAAAVGCEVSDLAAPVDTVSVCLSKGLGAPVGSVVCGDLDRISEARRWRRLLGGGMRQAGVIAAAGLFALDHHRERLLDDHANAERLAASLEPIEGIELVTRATNMVIARLDSMAPADFERELGARGFVVLAESPVVRFVTHLGVGEADVDRFAAAVAEVLAGS